MELNKDNKNLALIGAGYWGKNLARNFHQLGVLHSICDASDKTLKIFTEQYEGLQVTTNPDDIWLNERITRVAIAAPAAMHYELTKKALLAGKDVFVEKPLCLDLKEAAELVDLSKERNRILMVGHLLQYHPCVEQMKALLARGELGKLHYISSSRLNLGKIRKEENALWSFAPHDLSVILSLVGDMLPEHIQCVGGAYLNPGVVDTTMTTMRFPGEVRAHVYVSWLNPFKEQKLIVVCSDGLMVFDDTKPWNEKLVIYRQHLVWSDGQTPVPNKTSGEPLEVPESEPLKLECTHFIECCDGRMEPRTNGDEGLRVLSTLTFAQKSLEADGIAVVGQEEHAEKKTSKKDSDLKVHPSAFVDEGAIIGKGTRVWHFAHICSGAIIGSKCSFGQNTMVAGGVRIGNNVKVQNNVSIYEGLTIEDDVFLGPSCVLTNVSNPRAQVNRRLLYEETLIKKGASVGANATITPGVTLGYYCFIAAGAVVTTDVKNYALMKGVPAKQKGWISRHGHPLISVENNLFICPETKMKYEEKKGQLICVDLGEEDSLPEEYKKGKLNYRNYK